MPPKVSIYFSTFPVTSQIFHTTPLSFAIVNLKPLLPGHVLVCPRRVVPRLQDLCDEEITDLFLTVKSVGKLVERVYGAHGLNVAIQDGAAAGQSVPHVHTHIIPRRDQDLPEDEIYKLLEVDEANLESRHKEHVEKYLDAEANGTRVGAREFPLIEGERLPRSEEVMAREAERLRMEMQKEIAESS